MTDPTPPANDWRWWHTLAVIVGGLVVTGAFMWRGLVAVSAGQPGGGALGFLRDPGRYLAAGFPVMVEGAAPGAPRAAQLGLIARDSGDKGWVRMDLRLREALPEDSAAAWSGRCVGTQTRERLVVTLRPPGADSLPSRGLPIYVIADDDTVGILFRCPKEAHAITP